ncbi:MAG: hypothetical protein WC586_03770 [Methanoregula sp.]
MAEENRVPVLAILAGGVLIITGILLASALVPWIPILLATAGVASVLLGIAMLFGLAYGKPSKPKEKEKKI